MQLMKFITNFFFKDKRMGQDFYLINKPSNHGPSRDLLAYQNLTYPLPHDILLLFPFVHHY